MSEMVRIGVLGTARISERALIEPARQVPSVTVAAVAARSADRAQSFGLRHGIPSSYGSYEELLAAPDIDAVYVPLPNSLHAPWTLRAIDAGKHVLCEKPFASNAAEALSVAAAADRSGLVVMEAMHYRYHPLVRRMAALLADGAIGVPSHAQAWTCWAVEDPGDIRYDYGLAGGALMDGGCYAIDCLRLVGSAAGADEPAVTGALADPLPDRATDRAMAARVAFGSGGSGASGASGLTGWFESAFTRDGEFVADLHVIGSEGTLWLRNFVLAHNGRLIVRRGGSVVSDERAADLPDAGAGGLDPAAATTFGYQLRAFAGAAGNGEPFPTTAANAVTTMRLIDDAYQAAGLPVREGALPAAAGQQHLRHESRVVAHRHVPAAGQRHEPRVRHPAHGDAGLARWQYPVLGAPRDRHRHSVRDGPCERHAVGQDRHESLPGPQEAGRVGHGLFRGDVRGPADESALEHATAGRAARQRGDKRADRGAGQLRGREDHPGVTVLPRSRPEAGRGQPGDGRRAALRARDQREGAAERVARDVRTVQAELVEEREDLLGHRADRRAAGRAQRRRFAVAGQVHREDGPVRREQVKHRLPRLPPVPHPMQQHQRRPVTVPLIREPHGDLLPALTMITKSCGRYDGQELT
jgi:predicted dehydrogenase